MRAKEVDIKTIISQGMNPKSNRKTLEISKKYDIVKCALGIYPDDVENMNDDELIEEYDFIVSMKNEIVAIGEIGLDHKKKKIIKFVMFLIKV